MSLWDDYRDDAMADDVRRKPTTKSRKKKKKARKAPAFFRVDGFIDFDGVPHFRPDTLRSIHSPQLCQGRHCVIHRPSKHHMRNLPLIWDSLETQMHRLCEHDLIHPDPDDIDYWVNIADEPWKAEHECDGCCKEKK